MSNEFPLLIGGPCCELLHKLKLQQGSKGFLIRRLIVIPLFAWLPLLILSLLAGTFISDQINLTFLYDIEMHIRFLVALPCLIASEPLAHEVFISVIKEFNDQKFIPNEEREKFNFALERALKMSRSKVAELIILLTIYTLGTYIWQEQLAPKTNAWHSYSGFMSPASISNFWLTYISLPLFQFLLFRWYYKILIWSIFLFRVSRLNLNLIPSHPDQSGGLSFLGESVSAFSLILFGQGALLAGLIADNIFFSGATLLSMKFEIIGGVVFALTIVYLPFCFFIPKLVKLRKDGLSEYGRLATNCVREFHNKWIVDEVSSKQSLLESSDIQSLADLGTTYETVNSTTPLVFDLKTLLIMALITALPIFPLLLTMFPVSVIVSKVLELLF